MEPHAHRITTTATIGGKVEFLLPDLLKGETVEITIRRVDSDWDGYPDTGVFASHLGGYLSPEQVEAIILREREAWEG
jgi:hypothetical protein